MKIVYTIGAVLLVVVIAVVSLAPLGPLPGFFIGGEATEAPAEWQDTSDIDNVLLKVVAPIPRVVTIWIIQYQGELYVVGYKESGWIKMIGDGGPVNVRIEDKTYALNAARLETGWQPMMQAYIDKYRPDNAELVASFPPVEEAGDQIAVFHLKR